jgi:hypothetical protein
MENSKHSVPPRVRPARLKLFDSGARYATVGAARQALRAGARRGLMLWRSPLRSDSAVVLALKSRPELASLTSFATLKHAGRSQFWMRAARADFKTALLAATEIAPCGPLPVAPAAWQQWWPSVEIQPAVHRVCVPVADCASTAATDSILVFVAGNQKVPARQAVPGGGDFWGDEQRRLGVGARSALPKLTRGVCLSVTNEVSAASSPRDAKPSSAVESERSADRPSMSPRRVPPAAPRCGLHVKCYARQRHSIPARVGPRRGSTDSHSVDFQK